MHLVFRRVNADIYLRLKEKDLESKNPVELSNNRPDIQRSHGLIGILILVSDI